jgi:hypothetical protein
MDLLSEYNEVLDGFISGRLCGRTVWFKVTNDGNITMMAPEMGVYTSISTLRIEIPEVGNALEVVARVHPEGRHMFKLEVIEFREVEL